MVQTIILKYVLVPLIVALCVAGFAFYAKVNTLLQPKKLILTLLLLAMVLAIPALWGLLDYYFVPSGLIITQIIFFGLGIGFVFFMNSTVFQSVGFDAKPLPILLFLLVSILFGGWIFYLGFEFLSEMAYSLWVPLTMVWFLLPILFHFANEAFCSIPPVYYQILDPLVKGSYQPNNWENEDYLSMMGIYLNVKRLPTDPDFSSYPARAPANTNVSQWFLQYLNDQHIKFPNSPIETEVNGEPYCWIFYTTRFFIFNRAIAHDKSFEENRIRRRSKIYVRRVSRFNPQENSKS